MKYSHFEVYGSPKGQPRPRAVRRGAHAGVYDPGTADGWKQRVLVAALEARQGTTFSGPIRAELLFIFARPRSHYRTGKLSAQIRPDAPNHHTAKPDADNLAKAVLDALNGILYADDAEIAELLVQKAYAVDPRCAGVTITLKELAR